MTPGEDPTSLGNLLLDARMITPWQLSEGLSYARQHGLLLGEALQHLGHIDESAKHSAVLLQASHRARTSREAAANTHALVAYATDKAEPFAARLDDARERALDVMRRLRSRRATVKT